MGKKLIIKGADFSENGIHTPILTQVSNESKAIAITNSKINITNYTAINSTTAGAIKAKITTNYAGTLSIVQNNGGVYTILATGITAGSVVILNAATISGTTLYVQSLNNLTTDEQTALAGTSVGLTLYSLV